jgi:hypothetical protein
MPYILVSRVRVSLQLFVAAQAEACAAEPRCALSVCNPDTELDRVYVRLNDSFGGESFGVVRS